MSSSSSLRDLNTSSFFSASVLPPLQFYATKISNLYLPDWPDVLLQLFTRLEHQLFLLGLCPPPSAISGFKMFEPLSSWLTWCPPPALYETWTPALSSLPLSFPLCNFMLQKFQTSISLTDLMSSFSSLRDLNTSSFFMASVLPPLRNFRL